MFKRKDKKFASQILNMDSSQLGFFASLGSVAVINEVVGNFLIQNFGILAISIIILVIFYKNAFEFLRESDVGRIMILVMASLFSVLSAVWIILIFTTINFWLLISIGIFLFNTYALLNYALVR